MPSATRPPFREDYSREEEIADLRVNRPHVWLLGAGASRAAFPNGDAKGRRIPLMADLVDTLGLESMLRANSVLAPRTDFEALYSEVAGQPGLAAVRAEIEARVAEYFAALELPDAPTLYDHLVCSLRPKDVIATFNWDPFLYDAMARNQPLGRLPKVLFLHGNVRLGICDACMCFGRVDHRCHRCGGELRASPLLFPVTRKDYNSDPCIRAHWERFQRALKSAIVLSVFGYGAPQSDVEAQALMRSAWGAPEKRVMEQTQIIDVLHRDVLADRWAPFIHSHHYDVTMDFYDTETFKHPRRCCECFATQTYDARWVMFDDPPPRGVSLDKLHAWYGPRIEAERQEDLRAESHG